jgi:type II secretory pathway pseudopilin PulG
VLGMPAIRRTPGAPDRGLTLVEVCWVTLLVGIVAATSVTKLQGWTDAHDHSGTAAQIEGLLREAQQKAVTEGRPMCVDFDVVAQAYSLYRGSCDDAEKVVLQGPIHTQGSKVRISSPSFNGPGAQIFTGVTFAPRGTAWPGTVKVTRTDSSKVWTLALEGLTGRVSRA